MAVDNSRWYVISVNSSGDFITSIDTAIAGMVTGEISIGGTTYERIQKENERNVDSSGYN